LFGALLLSATRHASSALCNPLLDERSPEPLIRELPAIVGGGGLEVTQRRS